MCVKNDYRLIDSIILFITAWILPIFYTISFLFAEYWIYKTFRHLYASFMFEFSSRVTGFKSNQNVFFFLYATCMWPGMYFELCIACSKVAGRHSHGVLRCLQLLIASYLQDR